MGETLENIHLGRWYQSNSEEALQFFEKNRSYKTGYENIENRISVFTANEIKSDKNWSINVARQATLIMARCNGIQTTNYKYNNQGRTYTQDQHQWELTSTSITYSFIDNYEVREKFGDSSAKTILLDLVIEMYPGVSPQTLSETVSHTLAKTNLAEISTKMGWSSMLRTGVVEKDSNGKIKYLSTESMKEDIFESIFGLVTDLGNEIQEGLGFNYARNLMTSLINDGHIKLSKHEELPPKTAIEQLFKSKGWGKVVHTLKKDGIRYKCQLKFTDKAKTDINHRSGTINFTTRDMVNLINNKLTVQESKVENLAMIELTRQAAFGVGIDITKDKATEQAYANGAINLKKVGILTNIDEVKGKEQFISISLFTQFKTAYLVAKKKGYNNLYISKPAKNLIGLQLYYTCQLFGYKSDKEPIDLLITITIPIKEDDKIKTDDIRKMILLKYAELG